MEAFDLAVGLRAARTGLFDLDPELVTHLVVRDHRSGEWTMQELSENYGVSRATAYRIIGRAHREAKRQVGGSPA